MVVSTQLAMSIAFVFTFSTPPSIVDRKVLAVPGISLPAAACMIEYVRGAVNTKTEVKMYDNVSYNSCDKVQQFVCHVKLAPWQTTSFVSKISVISKRHLRAFEFGPPYKNDKARSLPHIFSIQWALSPVFLRLLHL